MCDYGAPFLGFMALIMHYEIIEKSFYYTIGGKTYLINEWAEEVMRGYGY